MISIQVGVNAELARWIETPIRAAFVSFLVGTLALLLLSLAIAKPLPSGSRLADTPWWAWVGGLFGAFYVVSSVVTAPRLGAATLIAAVIAGQLVTSVVIDQFGWVGFREHPISPGRLAGIGLVFGGVALVRIF